jgi:hypothetical protein
MPQPNKTIKVDADALVGSYVAYGAEHRVALDTKEGALTLTTSSTLGLFEPVRRRVQS